MDKRILRSLFAAPVLLALLAAPAGAASITLRPDLPLMGVPGSTLGWGYEITADADRDVFIDAISADVLLGSGVISVGVFDFPVVAAGTTVQLDYDALLGVGLVELTLSPGLSFGDIVTGRVFGEFRLVDPNGALPDLIESFDLDVTGLVGDGAPVPEPATLLLVAAGGGLAALRRRRRSR
jgi:hypothetical protein